MYHTFLCHVIFCADIGHMYKSVMASVLAPSAVDRGFEPGTGQTKDYKIGIFCFSAKHRP